MDPEFRRCGGGGGSDGAGRRYAAELQQGALSRQCRFEYGWGLVRSRYRRNIGRGVALLSELLPETPPEEQRDVLFYLALGNYRLKEYERALQHVERLLAAEPQNSQVLRLRSRVRSRLRRDGLVGAAIVGGVVMGVAGLLGVGHLARTALTTPTPLRGGGACAVTSRGAAPPRGLRQGAAE